MSNNEKTNGGFHALKVSKFDHSSTSPRATRWREWVVKLRYAFGSSIDRPFIVLTETKSSNRHIPVWARYSPHRTRVEAHANTLSP